MMACTHCGYLGNPGPFLRCPECFREGRYERMKTRAQLCRMAYGFRTLGMQEESDRYQRLATRLRLSEKGNDT